MEGKVDAEVLMSSPCVYTHRDGYQCDLAATPGGWAMIVTGFSAVDDLFVSNMDLADREWEAYKAVPREGTSVGAWKDA